MVDTERPVPARSLPLTTESEPIVVGPRLEPEPIVVEPRPVPTWRNLIPATFQDFIAGVAGLAVTYVVARLALSGSQLAEIAAQTLFTGFIAWLTWTTRGRIEQAKSEPKPLAEAR